MSGYAPQAAPDNTMEGTPAPPEYTAPSPPLAPPPARRTKMAVIAVVVAVVVVVAAVGLLYVGGIGPFSRHPSSSGVVANGQTYKQAVSSADQSAASYGSGPWNVVLASGVDLSAPVLQSTQLPSNLFSSSGFAGCTGTAEQGTSPVVSFLGFNGDLTTGQAPDWLLVLVGASGTVLFTTVIGGNATVWEKYSGSGCSLLGLIGTLPASIADSSTAVSAFMQSGGSSYVKAHAGGYLSFSANDLTGNGAWTIQYSTCPAVGNATASTTYYSYNATVSLSGSILGTPAHGSPHCSGYDPAAGITGIGSGAGTIALSTVFSLGSTFTEGPIPAGYAFNATVKTAVAGLVWSDIEFTVTNSLGKTASGPYGVEMFSTTGCGVAFGALSDPLYIAPLSGACTSGLTGGSAPVTVGEKIQIISTTTMAGMGEEFVAMGNTPYSGNVTAAIS